MPDGARRQKQKEAQVLLWMAVNGSPLPERLQKLFWMIWREGVKECVESYGTS
jgi:hypothetical protein